MEIETGDMVWLGMVWFGMVWYGLVWFCWYSLWMISDFIHGL